MKKKKHNKSQQLKKTICILMCLAFMLATLDISFAEDKTNERSIQKEASKHIRDGKKLYRQRAYEKAIEEFQKTLSLKPNDKTAKGFIKKAKTKIAEKYIKTGKRYYKKRIYEDAIVEFQKAIAIMPHSKSVKKLIKNTEKKLKKKTQYIPEKKAEKEQKESSTTRALTLDECIEIAMENSISLKIADKQLDVAKFKLLEAKRKIAPSVTAKFEESAGIVDEKDYEGRKVIIEGKQPLFYGGELIFSIKQALVNVEIVKEDYERIKNELILQAKKAYYSLDKAKKTLKVQKKLRDKTKKFLDIEKAAYEADVIAQIEFLKLYSQHNQSVFQVTSAEEDLALANLILQQAMSVDEEIDIVEVQKPNIIDIKLDECIEVANLNRPEVKISMLSLEFIDYERKITRARSDWPRVDFIGSYGNTMEDFVSKELAEGVEQRNLGPEYYVGAKVSMPIWGSTLGYAFAKESWQPVVSTVHGTKAQTHSVTLSVLDRMGDITKAKETHLEYMRSRDEFNKAKQEALMEIKEKFYEYRKAVILMEVAKSKVEYQRKQVEILSIQQSLGEVQHSDVVEEMIRLAEEEFSHVQAIADYYIAIASLNKAIGIDGYFKV